MCAKSLQLCLILCDPMDCSPLEYWSGLPYPLPGDGPDPGLEPISLMCPAFEGRFFTTSTAWGVAHQAVIFVMFWLPTLDNSDYFMILLALT